MKNIPLITALLLSVFSLNLNAQTTLALSDDMEISSNSDIIIEPGDYQINDEGLNGIIRIINKQNITIDGGNVNIDGGDFGGYFIYIENSKNIRIKNFSSVSKFYYAVKAERTEDIIIENNNFSYNKKDTLGWIYIWTGVNEALGGGILLDECSGGKVYGNTGIQQNDGLAMYNCHTMEVYENTFNWNCGFGIRMNYTDNCNIHHNDCSHVNRETDPSDCAAILLIVSNNNTVEHNDLTYSGDGIFLGQYEHSDIPNNNYFAYNDCSYSPHNAIEATFADGNVYKYNKCNFSHYGFWLGYSFNSLVEGNEIIGNFNSGIAVDRGFENTFINNEIRNNPYGFQLWEGGVINPYGEQFSHDYYIENNLIESNTWGIHAINTEHLVAKNNQFIRNKTDLYIEGGSWNDTITDNIMNNPTEYFIQNMSSFNILALNNTFIPNDRELIQRKMRGDISWVPFIEEGSRKIMYNPPCDMAEPDASWSIYADPGFGDRIDEFLLWDYEEKKVGDASLKFVTGRGWDIGINYRPGGDSIAMWNLSEDDTLSLWIRTIKNPSYGFQYFHIRVGSYDQAYYKYTASANLLNNANNRWRQYNIPLKGNSSWQREVVGNMDLSQTHYVEIHADTWDHGYTLWLDGVQFGACTPSAIPEIQIENNPGSICYPNPFGESFTIEYFNRTDQIVGLDVYDISGRKAKAVLNENQAGGYQIIEVDAKDLTPGIYFYRLINNGKTHFTKIVKSE